MSAGSDGRSCCAEGGAARPFIIDPSSAFEGPLAYDVLILGSGLAGMSAALHLASRYRVALVTKHELLDGASTDVGR